MFIFPPIKNFFSFAIGTYEVLLLLIFLAHLGTLIALLILAPRFEDTVKGEFDNIVNRINNASQYQISQSELDNVYSALYSISETFTCCGKHWRRVIQYSKHINKWLHHLKISFHLLYVNMWWNLGIFLNGHI